MMWIIALLFTLNLPPQATVDYYSLSEEDFFALPSVNQAVDPQEPNAELLEAAVFFASNQYRKSKRRKPLTFDRVLQASARVHSSSMMQLNFFSHINKKERKLRTPYDRVKEAGGHTFTSVGENLIEACLYQLGRKGAYQLRAGKLVDKDGNPLPLFTYRALAQDIVARWAKSKGHRENLLENYDFMGCGMSGVRTEKDGLKIVYITQNFGSKN